VFSQLDLKSYIEGRVYTNEANQITMKYGYISSLNTYGFTMTKKNGAPIYFMNCSSQISSDETFGVFSNCLNPENGAGLPSTRVYRDKIILSGNDGQLIFVDKSNVNRKNSNIESLNYNERKKSNDDPVFLFPIEIKLKNGKSIKVINVTRSPVDFKKATSDCASINQMLKTTEYRLPSKSEILALYSNRSKYDLPDGYVWTSEKNKEGESLLIEFSKNGVTEKYFEPYSFIFGKREAIAFFFKGPPASSTNNKKKHDWMVKNLDVVRFRNGDSIPQAKTTDEWKLAQKNKTPAWCFYDNNPANGVKFGKLYNWYAVNDPRSLSPSGWHVPSDSEWSALIAALGGMETSGAQMKSKTSWRTKMDFEKPLCSGCGNGSNLTGFNGFAGGSRLGDGRFTGIGEFGNWWTTTISKTTWTTWIWNIGLSYNSKEVSRYEVSFDGAFSVRCIKD
jgi:uncharacterized protein (TIGR02145 family)